jgi:hypothetical protein
MADDSNGGNDTYFVFGGPSGYDTVSDSGGTGDKLNLSHLDRSQVLISWHDNPLDVNTHMDALRVQQKGTTNSVLVRNYFDNQGGTGRGSGAIERIKFEGGNYVGFPASEG